MSSIDRLPLFPLGLVLYPAERLPLHIYEERYKEMIGRCVAEDEPFGVVLYEDERLARVGSTARVVRVLERFADGRMNILAEGLQRFRIQALYDDRAYLTADVRLLDEPDEPLDTSIKQRAIAQHIRLLELAQRTVRPSLYENVRELSYVLAQNAGLSSYQKQQLLEMPSENERMGFLTRYFEQLLPRIEEAETLRRKIQSNGHLKDFPPEEGG